jgi:hypothetical protein
MVWFFNEVTDFADRLRQNVYRYSDKILARLPEYSFVSLHSANGGTCKMHGIEPYGWLKEVLQRIADHPINKYTTCSLTATRLNLSSYFF